MRLRCDFRRASRNYRSNREMWTCQLAKHTHFSCGAERARPVRREFGTRNADHEESMTAGDLAQDLGKIPTTTMVPRRHCGHWRSEAGEVFVMVEIIPGRL